MNTNNFDDVKVDDKFKEIHPNGTRFLIEVEIDTKELDPNENDPKLGYNQILSCFFNKEKQDEFRKLTGTNINQIYKKNIFVPETHTLQDCVDLLNRKVKEIYEEGHPV